MATLITLTNLADLRELRELYRPEWPKNCHGYYTLSNFIDWFVKEPDIKNVKVYTLESSWRQNGLYLIVDRYHLFVNSLIPNDSKITEALRQLDWRRGYKITALPKCHYESVTAVLKPLNIDWLPTQRKLRTFHLPREKALQMEVSCPEGFQFRPLSVADAETLNGPWHSKQAGSLHFFKRLIKSNINVGVVDEKTQDLVAWCTRCHSGFLSSLHVTDDYRRRGLAMVVVNAFARRVAEAGEEEVRSLINVQNDASTALFIKLGFQPFDDIYHLFAFCVPKGLEWLEEEDEDII